MQLMGTVDVRSCLSDAHARTIAEHNKLVERNRNILHHILKCLIFCGRFELPLRGNDETEASLNHSIFLELVYFYSENVPDLELHIKGNSGRGSVTYLSKSSQNELLDCCFAVYQTEIRRQIQGAKFVAIMADETTDVSQTTQLVIVFRYIFEGVIKEQFWGFFKLESTTAEGISTVLLRELKSILGNSKTIVIGQAYDGAAVMRGEKNGVNVKLRSVYPHAHFIHCYAHQLNLILKSSATTKGSSRFFTQLTALSNYFSRSPHKVNILTEFMKKKIPTASTTRWNFSSRVVKTVHENYDNIVECLKNMKERLKETGPIDSLTVFVFRVLQILA